jgi:predicted nucleic acid-binding protein
VNQLYLIDTSAWLFVLGRKAIPELRERVRELVLDNQAAITPPIFFELLRGARTLSEAEALKTHLRSLHMLPYLDMDWGDSASWAARLARRGLTGKSIDLLIAFKAQQQGAILLHADHDFDRLAKVATSLHVESWVSAARRI